MTTRYVIDKDISKLMKQLFDNDYYKEFYQKWIIGLTKEYSKNEILSACKVALYHRGKSPAYIDKVLKHEPRFTKFVDTSLSSLEASVKASMRYLEEVSDDK